jgi:predicted extracellular nuclease
VLGEEPVAAEVEPEAVALLGARESADELLALEQLVAKTDYAGFAVATTKASNGQPYDKRNIVVLSRFPIKSVHQYRHDFAPAPTYRKVTASPAETQASQVTWERPILHVVVQLPDGKDLNVITVHLKSKNPTDIPGQKQNTFVWKSASAYAEGAFLSAMKRMGQAVEVRMLIEKIFDADADARIVVCGDFNAEVDDVPLVAIRGDVEDHGNAALASRVMLPCEFSIPASSRFSLYHHGKGNMLDHVLACRHMLAHYRGAEVHNELLHDESVAFAGDPKFPESDHAPVVATFEMP